MQAEQPKVPFADLYQQYISIKEEIDGAIADVIKASAFVRGPFVDRFELGFADAISVQHCVSCANGTDALYISMRALDVGSGDEVIVPAHSWISTSQTVTQTGANVVFCDTDSDTYTISPSDIESKITTRTVGIIPVHLYGQPAEMDAVMAIAKKHKLWVVEDCAQAHLARYKQRLVGTFGDAACFSFYPGKNLGAMGDAGAIVSNDAALSERMATFARHGGLRKNEHRVEGINSRLDGLQAAILSVKLRHLTHWTARRQQIAKLYCEGLSGANDVALPVVAPGREHVYHLFVVAHQLRDQLARHLAARGIQTVVNYPIALPFLPAYSRLKHRPEDFPNAYRNQSRILSLPIFAEMTTAQIEHVVQAVKEFCVAMAASRPTAASTDH